MAKRMLADVLWEAANEVLSPSQLCRVADYSCNAALIAEGALRTDADGAIEKRNLSKTDTFLRALGCDSSMEQFKAFPDGPSRQGVRYMWLLLAMYVAEDEGITA